jgi:hypothetical protein
MEYVDYECFNMIGRNFYPETQLFIDMAPIYPLSYHILQVEFVKHVGRFTHTDPLLTPDDEIALTGRQIELLFGEFYQIKDVKLGLLRDYYDAATMIRQLGLMP